MKVVQHKGAGEFLSRAGPWLAENEAENNLILGISSHLDAHPEQYAADPYLITLEHNGGPTAAALMTPPHELIVTRAPADAMEALAGYLRKIDAPVSAVVGLVPEVKTFAGCWTEKTGTACERGMSQRVYRCNRVTLSDYSPGRLRLADNADAPLLIRWRRDYRHETGLAQEDEDHRQAICHRIDQEHLYVWDHDGPVSMACWGGQSLRGARVFLVYTPSNRRKKGYASSCVAALTAELLDSGRPCCYLYADLANPTSNDIYQKIGYRRVCDSQVWRFV
ncbi:MAG TPA: GNAT family N-acetyltransferase [Thermoguttaceae bacterium]|nr:GNAT family N-acetyltransferase [Thermoguttaceae bacterium]